MYFIIYSRNIKRQRRKSNRLAQKIDYKKIY